MTGWTPASWTPAPKPKRERIFLSGGISGIPDYTYNFQQARYKLVALGYDVVDPSLNVGEDGWKWRDWMKQSIVQMLDCEGVALLPGYQYSKGALVEAALADALGLPVKMVDEWAMELDKG